MPFDGLIFDLDGTLWDCSGASAEAFNAAYEKFGIEKRVSGDFVKSISGRPANECDQILLSGVDLSIREDLLSSFDELEIAAVQSHAEQALYEGVREGLQKLSCSYRLYLVSNCGEKYLETFKKYTSIGDMFLECDCFGRTGLGKAANIRALVERRKIISACYIGDTAGDEEAARRADIPFFHVKYGFGTPLGIPVSFSDFKDLARYFIADL